MTNLHRVVVLLSSAAVILSGCSTGSTGPAEDDIHGIWVLEAFEVDGQRSTVQVGVNAARTPWVEIGDRLEGNGGCNDFGSGRSGPTVTRGLLIPGEVIAEAAACNGEDGSDLMGSEEALLGALWQHQGGISFVVDGPAMTWVTPGSRLEFTVTTVEPVPSTSLPPTSLGRLDCSPQFVVEDRVLDTGQDPERLLFAASPYVESVEFDPPFWWGYDEAGNVVAGVARGDVRPVPFHIYACGVA